MNREKNMWLSGAIALVATLLILFAGQAVWHTFAVAKPLDKAFEGIDGVQSVAWDKEKEDKAVTLRVTLGNTDNLQTTYTTIEERAKSVLGKAVFQITIHDSRSPVLEQVYHQMHYHIQEAALTGHFGEMADKISDIALKAGVESRVSVDAKNIYLQLAKDRVNLYTVVPRATNLLGVK